MKFYRVEFIGYGQESLGFTFHTSRREAERWAALKGGRDIETIEVKPTKRGILTALRVWAAHPDNG